MPGGKVKKYFVVFFVLLSCCIGAQEIEETKEVQVAARKNSSGDEQLMGLTFSFSGFNVFRFGMGLSVGSLGSDGHHPFGWDYGLLFEYDFKNNIKYNRVYFHITGGVGAMLLGGSTVIAYDNNDISIGFAPEIGIGLSTIGGIFFRYNFHINEKFNTYCAVRNRQQIKNMIK
jgi:hypothetical protein